MNTQSPSKRFTRGIPLHIENNIEHPSFFLNLTQDFGKISGSMSKSNTMQETRSKLRNDPIRFVDGGMKNHINVVVGISKKRKDKINVYTVHNDKTEAVVSRSLESNKVYI